MFEFVLVEEFPVGAIKTLLDTDEHVTCRYAAGIALASFGGHSVLPPYNSSSERSIVMGCEMTKTYSEEECCSQLALMTEDVVLDWPQILPIILRLLMLLTEK